MNSLKNFTIRRVVLCILLTAFALITATGGYAAYTAHNMNNYAEQSAAQTQQALFLAHATLVLLHGSDTEKAMVRAAIENGGIDQTHPDFNAVLTAITAGGALAYTRQLAQREVVAAKEALAFLPESEYKQVLLDLADYALAREV